MASFEEFWNSYPRKEGKAACLKKWEQKHLDEHALLIVNHVKQRAKDDKKWKDGFVPMPLTFLNQERWTDDYQRIQYRQPEATPIQLAEVYPQQCQWQVMANKILFLVLQAHPETPAERLPELVAMKQKMGKRLQALYGERSAPREEWEQIKRDGYQWLLKAARGYA